MFKRKIYEKLINWKQNHHNEYALLIEGARRIGKSTVALEFAKNEYDDYILFDFATESDDVKNEFNIHMNDLDTFFANIYVLKNKTLKSRNSLIIFDEVQMFPKARQAIKYLMKDNRYDYIETGSLISIKQNVTNIVIPSEEMSIKMFPMDFEEFLWAINDFSTADIIKNAFENKKPFDDSVHRKIMEKFRMYMCIGGMPQSIDEFIKKKNYEASDIVKREILKLYEEDIKKYDLIDRGKASTIYKTLTYQMTNKKAHFKYSLIDKNAREKNYIESLLFLEETMMVNIARNVEDPNTLLNLYLDYADIKMFYADTGLLISKAMQDNVCNENLYKSIICDKLSSNMGTIYENVVAQMLISNMHTLLFNKYKYKDETDDDKNVTKEKTYEIDFIIRKGKNIVPIEVKSSAYKNRKSIDNFYKKYNIKNHEKYIVYTKNMKFDDEYTYIPIYMVMCL